MVSLFWNISVEHKHAEHEATIEARVHFNKDKAFRLWGASHGGVYVPVDKNTHPNSNLSHIPERDIFTPSGRKLTLMNPAYMIRQIMDEYEDLYGVKGRIVSYPGKLFNQNNSPDAWELMALKAFESGEKEVKGIYEVDGLPYMRLMRPMFVQSSCLGCHGIQGYEVGDLRGGIGVAVPMSPYIAHEAERTGMLCLSYSMIWMFGLASGLASYRVIRNRTIERTKLTTKLERINYKLEKFSYQDGLTQIANRRMFDAILKREWASAKRNNQQMALIMIDLDHFKEYNDGYGHQAGDYCLSRVALSLNKVIKRSSDLVARYGGEEFVLLLPHTDEKQALLLARQCQVEVKSLQIPHEYTDVDEVVTISVGLSTIFPSTPDQPSSLLDKADRALYMAKRAGRNRVEIIS